MFLSLLGKLFQDPCLGFPHRGSHLHPERPSLNKMNKLVKHLNSFWYASLLFSLRFIVYIFWCIKFICPFPFFFKL